MLARERRRWFVFRALPEKRTTFPFFASEVCLHPESLRESYGLSN
ncbi:MAG: hypothetical protein U5L45_10575 [Saprospiraceae bacterium]|nr:hypothetical protein [Saprospiraceae bacterium]